MPERFSPQRVFVIGSAVTFPYQSTAELITSPDELNQIVTDPNGSLIAELQPERRDPLRNNEGRALGNFFPGNYLYPVKSWEIFKATIPDTWVPPKFKSRSVSEALAVATSLRALHDAGIVLEDINNEQLIVATGFTNSTGPLEIVAKIILGGAVKLDRNYLMAARAGLSDFTNTALREATLFPAPSILHQAACTTSLFNIFDGYRYLRWGEADLAVVGASEVDAINLWIYILTKIGAIANYHAFHDYPSTAVNPGDINPHGLVFSEGAVCFVLATENTVQKLKIPRENIQAEIIGGATGHDGNRLVPPNPPRELPRVMRTAIDNAQITPQEIGVLIPHGTGTKDGDSHDWQSATTVFQYNPDGDNSKLTYVTYPKSTTGHAMAASGGLSIITAIDIYNRGIIPPAKNISQPHPMTANIVNQNPQPWTGDYIQVCAVGMTGTVAAVVLRRPTDINF